MLRTVQWISAHTGRAALTRAEQTMRPAVCRLPIHAAVYDRLMAAMGRPDMGLSNPRYASDPLRCQHEAEIVEVGAPCVCEVGVIFVCGERALRGC